MSRINEKCMKSKLDLIWNELQTNLPSIDFVDSTNDDDEVGLSVYFIS